MPIYAVVSISGETNGSKHEHTTPSGSDGGANPTWNFPMEFKVGETALQTNSLALEFKLLSKGDDYDKHAAVGRLSFSVKQLFDSRKSPFVGGEDEGGELTFSYEFIDESAPNASELGWNWVENATKAVANGAGGAMKTVANGADEVMWTLFLNSHKC